jgi:hypothetical protein
MKEAIVGKGMMSEISDETRQTSKLDEILALFGHQF